MSKRWLAGILATGAAVGGMGAVTACNSQPQRAESLNPNDAVIHRILRKDPTLTPADIDALNDFCEAVPTKARRNVAGMMNDFRDFTTQMQIRSCDGKYQGYITNLEVKTKFVTIYSKENGCLKREGVFIPHGVDIRSAEEKKRNISNEEAAFGWTDRPMASDLATTYCGR
jgi:hypothetical protein